MKKNVVVNKPKTRKCNYNTPNKRPKRGCYSPFVNIKINRLLYKLIWIIIGGPEVHLVDHEYSVTFIASPLFLDKHFFSFYLSICLLLNMEIKKIEVLILLCREMFLEAESSLILT
jgi:hypothetical protein